MFTDSISLLYTISGSPLCGSRTYFISSSPISLSATELTVDPLGGLITHLVTDKTKIGVYTITVTVTLDNISPSVSGS